MTKTIAHLTDFSEASAVAFAHALALALAYKHRFYVLHVKDPGDEESWSSFPHIREILARWGIMPADVAPTQVESELGIRIAKVEIESKDVLGGILHFILLHRPDLMVLATHGREGVSRLMYGSRAEEIARRTRVPAIFIGPMARAFVNEDTGGLLLRRILVPVAPSPPPLHALRILAELLGPIGVSLDNYQFLHVGEYAPNVAGLGQELATRIKVMQGPVEETILQVAQENDADMIAMPTAGHHGFLDVLRGSTTEQVLRRSPCPVLAIPASASLEEEAR